MATNIEWRTIEGAWMYATDPLLTSTGAKVEKDSILLINNAEAFNLSAAKVEVNFVAKHYYYTSFGFVFNFNYGTNGQADTYFSVIHTRRHIYLRKHAADGVEIVLADRHNSINLSTNQLNKVTFYWNVEGRHNIKLILNDSTALFSYDNLDITDVGGTGSIGLATKVDGNVIFDNFSLYVSA